MIEVFKPNNDAGYCTKCNKGYSIGPHVCPVDSPPSKDEWQRRFAARIMASASWGERPAMQCAEAGYELMVSESPEFATDPEGAADEEMSCWTDDGDE